MFDPKRLDEIVMTAEATRVLGVRIGQVVNLGAYTSAQVTSPGFGTPKVAPQTRIVASLVTQRQQAAAVAWQASVAAVVGVGVGIPLGVALGRQLWVLFARNIYAVSDPTVPVVSVLLVAFGALAFANLVAALPGRSAARTPTALVLRAE